MVRDACKREANGEPLEQTEDDGLRTRDCDITFGWHGKDENLSGADTILTMTGIMIQPDPSAGAEQDENPSFLQLFAITGGTGKYVGAKGQATIDPSLGLQDYHIVLA